jgi:hypothetical protein
MRNEENENENEKEEKTHKKAKRNYFFDVSEVEENYFPSSIHL